MNRRIAVRAIIMHGEKLLCVRLNNYAAKPITGGDYWCLPGGGVEPDEALLTALKREMIEETAVTPDIGALLYVHQFVANDTEHLEFFFHVVNTQDYLAVDLSRSTHGVAEIAEISFIEPKVHNVKPLLLTIEPLAEHITSNAPPKFFSYLA